MKKTLLLMIFLLLAVQGVMASLSVGINSPANNSELSCGNFTVNISVSENNSYTVLDCGVYFGCVDPWVWDGNSYLCTDSPTNFSAGIYGEIYFCNSSVYNETWCNYYDADFSQSYNIFSNLVNFENLVETPVYWAVNCYDDIETVTSAIYAIDKNYTGVCDDVWEGASIILGCGNGIIDSGEQCDLGVSNGVCPGCDSSCRICGGTGGVGFVPPSEEIVIPPEEAPMFSIVPGNASGLDFGGFWANIILIFDNLFVQPLVAASAGEVIVKDYTIEMILFVALLGLLVFLALKKPWQKSNVRERK